MNQVVLITPGRFGLRDAAMPAAATGEALVRVHRIGVCGTDLHAFAGRQPFFEYPRVLGHELGVEVLEVHDDDSGLRPGDLCALEPYLECGRCIACRRGRTNCCETLRLFGVHIDGGMQTHMRVPVRKLHRSTVLGLDQLALVETLGIGCHAVKRAGLQVDETALVVGAGPIGLGVVQFAVSTGARVFVLDINELRLRYCMDRLGVAGAMGPARQANLADQVRDALGGELPLVVFDATGNLGCMKASFDLVAPGGRLVYVGLSKGEVSFDDPSFHRRELTLLATRNSTAEDFRDVMAAMEAGRIDLSAALTHRLDLIEVPDRFGATAKDPALIKAMINVP